MTGLSLPSGTAVVQRRAMTALVGSQILGGVGTAAGIAVGSILAAELVGSADLAGMANTTQVLGGAVFTAPLAWWMARSGRRAGLAAGYLLGAIGAAIAVAAATAGSFTALLVGTALFGGATAASGQARYAATDLAEPKKSGRALSMVVWATTIGAVAGPNLLGPSGRAAAALGLPPLSGPFLVGMIGFLLAALLIMLRMRPDPLLTAKQLLNGERDQPQAESGSLIAGLRSIVQYRPALIGAAAVVVGHIVMVSVMVMTPLQMKIGGASLKIVGVVVSVHILGMYAFSPVVGSLVDRVGAKAVIITGAAILLAAAVLAGAAGPGASGLLTAGLLLLGIGWSLTLTAGSTMLTTALPIEERAAGQGATDTVMGLAAAGGSALAGVVVGAWGFGWLCIAAAVLAIGLGGIASGTRTRAAAQSDGPAPTASTT